MSGREHQKHMTFLAIAGELSLMGTCDRKNVGAVIVKDGRAVSWGYNGAPPGLPHCDTNNHGYLNRPREGWAMSDQEMVESFGCVNSTHAEANAVAAAAKQGISTDGCTLYVTVSPCEVCARLLIAAGIMTVYYEEAYRDPAGIRLLDQAGVLVVP